MLTLDLQAFVFQKKKNSSLADVSFPEVIYFIFATIDFNLKNIEFFLILIIVINSFNKIYIWSNFRVFIKKDLNKIFKNILFDVSFAKLSIIILPQNFQIMVLQRFPLVFLDNTHQNNLS